MPSGTSLKLAEGTRIHSARLPSFVVTTEIVFGGAAERLVLRHRGLESLLFGGGG